MADAITSITVIHQPGITPASAAAGLVVDTSDRTQAVVRAANLLSRVAHGVEGATVLVRVDSVTPAAASGSFTCVQASLTAGDKLHFFVPGYAGPFTLTAKAGTASAVAGEYSIDTSNTAVGISAAAAINALPGLKDIVSATESVGTVTWTAKRTGTAGNSISITKVLTNAAGHVITAASGGKDTSTQPTMTVTFGAADIVANDTISIGARKYTWKAAASADGEITLSTTPATAATNFATAVNADTHWTGLISASAASDVVTLTWLGDPRVGKHIVMDYTETNATSIVLGGTLIIGTGEAFTPTTTLTGSSATKRYVLGAGA